jgi:membrane protein required for colicin V production
MVLSLVIIVIILIFVILGLRNGFIRWMTVTLGMIVGFWMASQKYFVFENSLMRIAHSQHLAHVIGFFLIFLLFFLIVVLFGYLLSKVVNLTLLSWLDRFLGAVFGLAAGLIFVWLLLILVITVQPKSQRYLSKSPLVPKILEIGQRVSGLPLQPKVIKKYLTSAPETLLLKPPMVLYYISLNNNLNVWRNDKSFTPRKEA